MFKVNKNIKQLLGSADREKMKCFLLECRLEKRKKGKSFKLKKLILEYNFILNLNRYSIVSMAFSKSLIKQLKLYYFKKIIFKDIQKRFGYSDYLCLKVSFKLNNSILIQSLKYIISKKIVKIFDYIFSKKLKIFSYIKRTTLELNKEDLIFYNDLESVIYSINEFKAKKNNYTV
jgi:hypothetical protein